MADKIKMTAVNYLNTSPFKYGMTKFRHLLDWAEINYATPAECAQMLIDKKTNIALAPVAVLSRQSDLNIITNYCLSTNDVVKSVKLYSYKPIQEIETIILDYQSLSSVSLIKVLMRYYWKKEVCYIQGTQGFEKQLNEDAMVVIGDRTFELNGTFPYEYDLAEEWFKYYGKPFVFAAWISNLRLNNDRINTLNQIFEYGINHLDEVVEDAIHSISFLRKTDINTKRSFILSYLKNNIQYQLTEDRKESIEHFLYLLKTMETEKVL
jgi:chorismate dehydratase